MSSSTSKPTVAIFGATGGTGLSILKNSLASGHTVNVLARTPSKLSCLSTQYPNLHVIQGDIYDNNSIKETLVLNNRVVDVVVSGIGMVLQQKGMGFTSSDKNICENGTKNILAAISELECQSSPPITLPTGGPKLILLSTTGISSKSRDIPIPMIPLYHWMLALPHADKKKMESVVIDSGRRWVLVRPSLLTDGEAKGLERVRAGVEVPGNKEEGKHAVGYTIRRDDVGTWVYEECIRNAGAWEKWEGKCVSLTY